MQVQFYGVRGSVPTPGPDTVRYGGNTSCVRVDLDRQTTVVMDAGTGIVRLGLDLMESNSRIVIALSHLHWDHIQGLPFFKPLYQPGRVIDIVVPDLSWAEWLRATLDGHVYCPVAFDQLPADISFSHASSVSALSDGGVELSFMRTNHSGGCVGYRLSTGSASVVYMPDNELSASGPASHESFVRFGTGTDLLIHDAQFLDSELELRSGWGHSCLTDTCTLAREAQVRNLALFHHDPQRNDEALDLVEAQAGQQLAGCPTQVFAAAEGHRLVLT